MGTDFSRTVRSLKTSGASRKVTAVIAIVAILATWIFWFLKVPVAVYETTELARLEVTSVARPVASLVGGKVIQNHMTLGQEVEAGGVLVQVDDMNQRLALETGRKRLVAFRSLLETFDDEIAAERYAEQASLKAAELMKDEQHKNIEKAEARAKYSEKKFKRVRELRTLRVVSDDEFDQSEADSTLSRLNVVSLEAMLKRLIEDQKVEQSDRQTRIAKLIREREEFEVQVAEQTARLRQLEHFVELCKVRAPVSGRVGQMGDFPVGSAVSTGVPLAFVVPNGKPRTVAFFSVAAAGRIRPGQTARLRLSGFPWTQYGSLSARVVHVGSESDNEYIRVELDVQADLGMRIPVEHGLPCSAEVTVERVPPVVLVLRAIGWFLRSGDSFNPAR